MRILALLLAFSLSWTALAAENILLSPDFEPAFEHYSQLAADEDPVASLAMFPPAILEVIDSTDYAKFPLVVERMSALHRKAIRKFREAHADVADAHLAFFNMVEEYLPIAQIAYSARMVEHLQQALQAADHESLVAFAEIFSRIGSPDSQNGLILLIEKARLAAERDVLIRVLGRIGNQIAANYIYEKLQKEKRRIWLDALVDAGLPSFRKIYENKNLVEQALNVVDAFKDGLKAGQVVALFKRDFAAFKQTIEKAMTRLSLTEEEKQFYRERLFQHRGEVEPAGGYRVTYKGVEFREGDLVLGLLTMSSTRIWSALTTHPNHYGHGGVVVFVDGYPFLLEMNSRLMFSPLERRLNRLNSYLLFRHRDMNQDYLQKLRVAFGFYKDRLKEVKYDLKFDSTTDLEIYCTEIMYHMYKKAGIPVSWEFAYPLNAQAAENFKILKLEGKQLITDGVLFRLPEFVHVGTGFPALQMHRLEGKFILDSFARRFVSKKLTIDRVKHGWLFEAGAKLGKFVDFLGMKSAPSETVRGYLAASGTLLLAENKLSSTLKKEKLSPVDFARYHRRLGELTEEITAELYRSLFED